MKSAWHLKAQFIHMSCTQHKGEICSIIGFDTEVKLLERYVTTVRVRAQSVGLCYQPGSLSNKL